MDRMRSGSERCFLEVNMILIHRTKKITPIKHRACLDHGCRVSSSIFTFYSSHDWDFQDSPHRQGPTTPYTRLN
jgi:hypothetical protein